MLIVDDAVKFRTDYGISFDFRLCAAELAGIAVVMGRERLGDEHGVAIPLSYSLTRREWCLRMEDGDQRYEIDNPKLPFNSSKLAFWTII